MKIKFKPRHNHNHNDCWCDALAFALNKPYEEIYELMKPFKVESGELNDGFIKGVLHSNDFESWTVGKDENITIREFIQNYNTYDNLCVLFIDQHVLFTTNATVYDNIEVEERNKYLDRQIEVFAMKPKEN